MTPEHIWADDLTGAAEVADLLAARTGSTVGLALGDQVPAGANIVVHDLDLRHSSVDAACAVLSSRLADVRAGERVFVKIDSQLHGPVAGYLAAMLDGGRSVVLSGANPAIGRVTIDGRHRVPGSGGVVTTALAELLAHVRHRLVTHRSVSPLGPAPEVLAADAQDQADLDTLATIAVEHGLDVAGGAALLGALLGPAQEPVAAPPPHGRQLVAVIGSTERAARAQLDAAAAHEAIEIVEAHPRQISEAIDVAARVLRDGRHVAIARSNGAGGLAALAEVAEAVLADRDPGRTATLLTGGHTARLVLDRLGIDTLTVVPDRPGAVVRLRAPSGLTVFTKPGSYGAADAVVELLESLHHVPHEEYR